eukprot:1889291-Amphidinium_carterae.1
MLGVALPDGARVAAVSIGGLTNWSACNEVEEVAGRIVSVSINGCGLKVKTASEPVPGGGGVGVLPPCME